jgi:hypothetical protein
MTAHVNSILRRRAARPSDSDIRRPVPAKGENAKTKPFCFLYSTNFHGNEPFLEGSAATSTALPGNKRRPRKRIQLTNSDGRGSHPHGHENWWPPKIFGNSVRARLSYSIFKDL